MTERKNHFTTKNLFEDIEPKCNRLLINSTRHKPMQQNEASSKSSKMIAVLATGKRQSCTICYRLTVVHQTAI